MGLCWLCKPVLNSIHPNLYWKLVSFDPKFLCFVNQYVERWSMLIPWDRAAHTCFLGRICLMGLCWLCNHVLNLLDLNLYWNWSHSTKLFFFLRGIMHREVEQAYTCTFSSFSPSHVSILYIANVFIFQCHLMYLANDCLVNANDK